MQIVILDTSIFHPQGGGQPDDEGYMDSEDGAVKFTLKGMKIQKDAVWHIGVYEPEGTTFKEG